MTKIQFLLELREKLTSIPQEEMEAYLSFYAEMIEDRMEEGVSEGEAVASVGTVEEIAAQILAENAAEEKKKAAPKKNVPEKKKRFPWLLLILGAPVWLALLIGAFSVVISLYVSAWSVIAALWAGFAALCGCTVACLVGGIAFLIPHTLPGVGILAAGLVCAGLSILWFFPCKLATKGLVALTKLLFRWIKKGVA